MYKKIEEYLKEKGLVAHSAINEGSVTVYEISTNKKVCEFSSDELIENNTDEKRFELVKNKING